VGGRTCSTNVVAPVVTAIARLGYDHMDVLGSTLTEIAGEKAGIMKRGVPCFAALQEPEAAAALRRHSAARAAPLFFVEAALPPDVALGLAGAHQRGNAALALLVARYWLAHHARRRPAPDAAADAAPLPLPDAALLQLALLSDAERRALAAVSWRGRAQIVAHRQLLLHLDGAHTAESCTLATRWFVDVSQIHQGKKALVCNFKPNKQVSLKKKKKKKRGEFWPNQKQRLGR
jgi:folylpolyglutamate synthase